jgi:hypothetical protein
VYDIIPYCKALSPASMYGLCPSSWENVSFCSNFTLLQTPSVFARTLSSVPNSASEKIAPESIVLTKVSASLSSDFAAVALTNEKSTILHEAINVKLTDLRCTELPSTLPSALIVWSSPFFNDIFP